MFPPLQLKKKQPNKKKPNPTTLEVQTKSN